MGRLYNILRDWFRRTFGISKTEINGYFVLLGLAILVHFAITRYPGETTLHFEKEPTSDSIWLYLQSIDTSKYQPLQPYFFDPNTVSYDSMIDMGLIPQIAKNVVRYRQSGGKFSKPGDLSKIYGMSDSLWVLLEPWIVIHSVKTPKSGNSIAKNSGPSQLATPPIDINMADSSWFQTIYGIGPVLSARIVKYRALLGGFTSLAQLNEVYGLSSEVINEIMVRVELDTMQNTIKKLNINTDDIKTLGRHPYLTFNLAKAIVSYREVHGAYCQVEEIKKIHIIDDSTYLRVSPYLDF